MSTWKITRLKKNLKLKKPILIEGMPGIGNVGKIATDMIIEQLKAEKVYTFFSTCLPNSVFVKENNLVDLPSIALYHKKVGKQDFLFLAGDVQPTEEEDSYEFTGAVLDIMKKEGCPEIVALGGIGLAEEPEKSKIYVTGTDRSSVDVWVKMGAENELYGVVGPIMGVTGLLLGLGKEKNIPAVALLAETYVHPMHIGLNEAHTMMKLLEKKYRLGLDTGRLAKDIKKLTNQLKPVVELQEKQDTAKQDTTYIG